MYPLGGLARQEWLTILVWRRVNNPFYAKKHTDDILIKLSALKKGDKNPMFGKDKSPEFIHKMYNKSGSDNPNAKCIQFYNVNTYEVLIFNTIKKAEKHFNTSRSTFYNCINSNRLYKKLWEILKNN